MTDKLEDLEDQLRKSFESIEDLANYTAIMRPSFINVADPHYPPSSMDRYMRFAAEAPHPIPEKKKVWRNITDPWEVSKDATQD